jgi:hypothetical protein
MTADVDLQNRIAELEQRQLRFKLATTGAEGWENYIQSLILQEREYLLDLLTEVVARLQREIIAEAKALLDQALAMRVRGTYQAGTKYARGDMVVLDGGSFLARKDDPGPCPSSHWQLMSKQGQRGIAGEKGPPGRDAPRIVSWKLDRQHYLAIPVMSDGKEGPALELRALFEDDNTAA